jgi:hypothetical protein
MVFVLAMRVASHWCVALLNPVHARVGTVRRSAH